MQTPLTDIASPKIRQTLYLVYTLLALISGALQIAYSSGGWGQPVWLTVGVAVLAFLGGALGLTAASNVQVGVPAHDDPLPAPATSELPSGVQPT